MLAHDSNGHAATAACPRCGYPNGTPLPPAAPAVAPPTSGRPPDAATSASEFAVVFGATLTPDEWRAIEGKHVAWSFDGREVLAVADSARELYRVTQPLYERGIDHIHGYVPHPDDPGII